jgi:two-component system KDP operon response regulator KdpE
MRPLTGRTASAPRTLASPLVLAIDGEPGILRLVKLGMQSAGLQTITALSGAEGLRLAAEHDADVAVVDLATPGISGLDVLGQLKARSTMPVLMMSAGHGDHDRARSMACGADDYIAKPFRPDELGARVRAALRRSIGSTPDDQVLSVGPLDIDLDRKAVRRHEALITLTPTEWKLLQQLATHAGSIVPHDELLGAVWGAEYRDDLPYLRLWIARLQRKLQDGLGAPAITGDGQGFGLRPPDDDAPAASST